MNNFGLNNARLKHIDFLRERELYWIDLANKRLADFNHQLVGLAILLLSLTFPAVAIDLGLGILQKQILVTAWVTLLASILSGIFQIWDESKFFTLISRDNGYRKGVWMDTSFSFQEARKEVEKRDSPPLSSGHKHLWCQVATLIIGLGLLVLVAATALFG